MLPTDANYTFSTASSLYYVITLKRHLSHLIWEGEINIHSSGWSSISSLGISYYST